MCQLTKRSVAASAPCAWAGSCSVGGPGSSVVLATAISDAAFANSIALAGSVGTAFSLVTLEKTGNS